MTIDLTAAINDAMDNHEPVRRRPTAAEFLETLESHGYTIVEKQGRVTADAVIAAPDTDEPPWVLVEDDYPLWPAHEPDEACPGCDGIKQFQMEDR